MERARNRWIVGALILAMSAALFAQSSPSAHPAVGQAGWPGMNLPASSRATVTGFYTFPGGKQQIRNYIYSTFGPPAFISTAVGAGLDQKKPAPPEWGSGAEGYGERYGWRFGMQMIGHTSEYSLGALVHEDVAYHRCDCTRLIGRSSHAISSTLTAKTTSGRTIFSVPSLVSPYVGSFVAVGAWYPSRYEPADAFRIGSTSFLFKAVGNLVGEFIAPRR
jgi:hypothetical protein